MATQMSFGAILREARERRGLDLTTAARRLRIRPDILRAIEENDFSRMPPRGYTRNMVNAYARLVGLNPTELTRMYLDEAYVYQVGRARNEAQPTGFDMGGSSRRGARPQREGAGDPPPRQNALGRTLYDDRTDSGGRTYAQDRTHPSRHAAVPGTQYTNFYAGPKAPAQARSKLPFVIAAAVILVVLVVVLVLVFGNKGASEQDVPSVPITGLTDTSNPDDGAGDGAAQTPPTPIAPDKVVFSFSVASGTEAYIEVYEGDGGPSIAEDVAGPTEKQLRRHHHAQVRHDQPGERDAHAGGRSRADRPDDRERRRVHLHGRFCCLSGEMEGGEPSCRHGRRRYRRCRRRLCGGRRCGRLAESPCEPGPRLRDSGV